MADKLILVDTSILIDFYRKTNKANSAWMALVRQEYEFAISVISKFEIYSGATTSQLTFWDSVLQRITVFPFDEKTVDKAVDINKELKRKRKQIDIPDLFIAATAVQFQIPPATLNWKHFARIDGLVVIE
ncbi:type II toxin-antitoxin system VapC family toxin [Flavihumibacter profundi]|uniref:type II toxin-antitoxin system VapC family toxin n=1 Tax=Flavihumibacter profundi TaxID=2716883 RepID=UPI001CC5F362|nr:type II toxin-antitoxin system VapC family toxin [Flavihumibacter profundi]MBZ5858377.1 type II toxin-antitoxin system VapC family toxin [Flavihumibacter profundi]